MAGRRKGARAGRMQKIVAVLLLMCLVLSGLAFFAASTISQQPAPQPTQQVR